MKIIYENSQGILCVIHPTGMLSLEETARKDVPAGIPYLFVEDTDIPVDRTLREAWSADFSDPDGYGLGHDAWFAERTE